MNQLKEAALAYADMGWKVFPLIPKEKKPATEHGLKDATTDKRQIEKWWSYNANYNIGVCTGEESNGLYIIDVDEDKEHDKHGLEVFKKWQQEHGHIDNTVICRTPRGGQHLYFYNHDGFKNKAGINGCIDVRAVGGYIVAPPSIHPNGGQYSWIASPGFNKVAELPKTWIDYVNGLNQKEKPKEEPKPEKVGKGSRTDFLIRKLGELCNTSLSKETIKQTIRSLNASECSPPLTEAELGKEVFPALDRGWQDRTELPELNPIKIQDLLQKEIAPIKYYINDICPAGLGILAAPPKYYKSFFALQICVALSQGARVLDRATTKTECLYFDLESSNRRPQARLKAMGINSLDGIYFVTQEEMPKRITLSNGFAEMLDKFLETHPGVGFVVIDVFTKIRGEQKRSQNLYEHDYEDLQKLQSIAGQRNVGILLLHHTRKMKDESDPFNNMGGSIGVMAAVDFAWIISKEKRNDEQAILNISGRDIDSVDLAIKFNTDRLNWEFMGTPEDIQAQKEMEEYDNSNIVRTIRKLVEQDGTWSGTISDLVAASRYFHTEIYEKSQRIGMAISKYSDKLSIVDNIRINYKSTGSQRIYTFTKK